MWLPAGAGAGGAAASREVPVSVLSCRCERRASRAGSSPTSGGGEAVQQQGGHVTWYRAPESPVLALPHSWCAGTGRDYISAEAGVLWEEWRGSAGVVNIVLLELQH